MRLFHIILVIFLFVLITSCSKPNSKNYEAMEYVSETSGFSVLIPDYWDIHKSPTGVLLSASENQITISPAKERLLFNSSYPDELVLQAAAILSARELAAITDNAAKQEQLTAIMNQKTPELVTLGTRQWFRYVIHGNISHIVYGTLCENITILAVHSTTNSEKAEKYLLEILNSFKCRAPNPEAVNEYLNKATMKINELNKLCWDTACKATDEKALEQALSYCNQALEIYPAPPVIDSKAFVLHKLGRIDEAIDLYKQVIEQDPNSEHVSHLTCAEQQLATGNNTCLNLFCKD